LGLTVDWVSGPGEQVDVWWEGDLAGFLAAAVDTGTRQTWVCALPYQGAELEEDYPELPDTAEARALIAQAHSHLGEPAIGAMEWRHPDGRWFGFGWTAGFRTTPSGTTRSWGMRGEAAMGLPVGGH
jgi:hypothetical protein